MNEREMPQQPERTADYVRAAMAAIKALEPLTAAERRDVLAALNALFGGQNV